VFGESFECGWRPCAADRGSDARVVTETEAEAIVRLLFCFEGCGVEGLGHASDRRRRCPSFGAEVLRYSKGARDKDRRRRIRRP
jgi:hypothetical protein